MKNFNLKSALLGLLLIPGALFAKNTINIGGTEYGVDTLVYKHNIGPGTKYAFYNLPDRPLTLHVMEVDLNNPYVEIETCLSGDSAVAIEQPSHMYARNDYPGHDMIGATNGDFYQFRDPIEIGIPRSGQYRNGECVTNPVGRVSFILSKDRKGYVDNVNFSGTLTSGGKTTRLHAVNMQRLEWEDTKGDFMLLYTNSYGKYCHKSTGGTKAIIRPKTGDLFFSSNKDIECVVESVFANPGISPIPENAAVLYGVGPSETYLKGLKAGDAITVNLGTTLVYQPGEVVDFKEQVGGSNEYTLWHDEPWGDKTTQHPRTAIGVSKDRKTIYFVAIDGRQAISAGASIETIGQCLKFVGAYDGVNLDGGGSTCMVVNKRIVNSPSDGKERAVGNGMLIFSKAPQDDAIGILEFEARPYNVPITARFRPVIKAFNKYGVLKSEDFKDVKFTCSPNIGTINENNEFIATDKVAEGTITATYNGLSVTQKVKTMLTPLTLLYDKYVVDYLHETPVVIESIIGITVDKVDPGSVNWTVEDPEICKVVNGNIIGIKDGTTRIFGKSDNFDDTVTVVVQNPVAAAMPVNYPTFPTECKIKQTGGKGITIAEHENGFKLDYTGNGVSRGAYISIDHPVEVWGMPSSIRIKVNPGETTIKKISMNAENAIGDRVASWVFTTNELPKNKESVYELKISDWCDAEQLAVYPIKINSLRFDMGPSKKDSKFTITVPGFEALYPKFGGIATNIIAPDVASIYPNPIKAGESFNVEVEGKAEVNIYSLNGAKVLSTIVEGTTAVSSQGLTAGVYFVTVAADGAVKTAKLIVE